MRAPIFSEFLPYWNNNLIIQKQREILNKIKKPITFDPDHVTKANDAGKITDLVLKDDGTVNTFVQGEKYPINTYPDMETVWVVAFYKRLIPLIIGNLTKMGWLGRISTLLAIKYNFNILPEWFEMMFNLKPVCLKDEHYCRPVKEFRRVLKGVMHERLVDGLSLVLEYDSAYRYAFQDIISQLNKVNDTRNEIERLFKILFARSNGGSDEQKYVNIYKFINLYLIINPKILKTIKKIIDDIDIDKIEPTEADRYYMLYLVTYNCFGLPLEERLKQYEIIKNS